MVWFCPDHSPIVLSETGYELQVGKDMAPIEVRKDKKTRTQPKYMLEGTLRSKAAVFLSLALFVSVQFRSQFILYRLN
jgi:hypothetical protein